MTDLAESATWEAGVYQLETTDPVQGGEFGISNTPARQLGNRTRYLKDQLEAEAVARAAADSALASGISSEASARAAADTSLATDIGNEASARAAADTSLATDIGNEASARAAADTSLATDIGNEASARAAADTSLATDIGNEATARAAADTTLTSAAAAAQSTANTANTKADNNSACIGAANGVDMGNISSPTKFFGTGKTIKQLLALVDDWLHRLRNRGNAIIINTAHFVYSSPNYVFFVDGMPAPLQGNTCAGPNDWSISDQGGGVWRITHALGHKHYTAHIQVVGGWTESNVWSVQDNYVDVKLNANIDFMFTLVHWPNLT
jgi:hypothetical protein